MTGDIAKAKAALPLPASMQLNQPLPRKQCPAVIGGLMQQTVPKRRATAEAWSKKRQFYKPLLKEFRRDGFQYRQVAREGDIAIYEKVWTGRAEPSRSYELIRIRRRDGFQIGSRLIEPAEVYPASELWGGDGFTFTDCTKAWAKFFEISLEEPERKGKEVC
jgi:hypothetical protein